MDCKFCDTKMIKTRSYGDGYIEPFEEYYSCPCCGAELEYTQGFDNEYFWIKGDRTPDNSDDSSEDETLFVKMINKQIQFSKTSLLLCYTIALIIIGYAIIKFGGI